MRVCVCPFPARAQRLGEGADYVLFCLKPYVLIDLYIEGGFIMATLV